MHTAQQTLEQSIRRLKLFLLILIHNISVVFLFLNLHVIDYKHYLGEYVL